jgi:ABC-type oligopeptide transport system substrate-binding subunit
MKRLILCFTVAAIVTASITTGCSSQKDASDTKDTNKVVATPASGDTTYMDTTKKDTTHH